MAESFKVNPWIEGLTPYAPGKTADGKIKLASNENNYGPSPKVIAVLKELGDKINVYPYKTRELGEKTAGYCKVGAGNIILGNGSDELIDLILKVFGGPSLAFTPGFSEYRICSQTLGLEYSEVRLNPDFSLPADEFVEAAEKANVVFLASPNNPTGSTVEESDIKRVLDTGKIVVVDEAYYEFYGETIVPLVNEYSNLIVLRTFSKAFGLAGLRVGYAVACRELIGLLNRVKPPFNVNSLAHEKALVALEDLEYLKSTVEEIKGDRRLLYNALNKKYRAFPSEANFVLADVSPMTAKEFYDKMFEKGFIVREFGEFPGFSGQYVRVTVGTTEENQKFIEALDSL